MQNRKCGNTAHVNETAIERHLVDQLDEKLSEVRILAEKQKKTAQSTEAKVSALKRKIERTKDLYVNGLIDLDKCKADVAMLQREIERIDTPVRVLDENMVSNLLSSGWQDVYKESEKTVQRGFWLRLIQRIEVTQDKEIEFYLQ